MSHAVDHVMKFPRVSPSVFAYCKPKTGGVEGLGTRLGKGADVGMGISDHQAKIQVQYFITSIDTIVWYFILTKPSSVSLPFHSGSNVNSSV